ncbi:MAG: M20/M25/M40 family metallo-hydrolase [Chitinispirillales bacterium]|nr:M20/M25/M40 family metallo-hydrolase [Chitinispirillales bacterium]
MKKLKHFISAPFTTLAPCVLAAFFLFCGADDNPPDDIIVPIAEIAYGYFVEISGIPRCTYNEEAASNHLAEFGRARGFEVVQDSMFNVLVKKGGSRGRENEPPVILQAHIDMVCRKDDDVIHDFDNDPIVPVIGGDGWVTASKRTTLGADNGGGVSMIMAVLASNISHPPIEALFTTVEETGLHGADFFDVSQLSGRRLINLDITEEEVFVVKSKRDDGGAIVIPIEPAALAKIASLPDWDYREDSPLRDTMDKVFREFYGRAPVIAAINNRIAGVECLVFAAKMPDADMISIGITLMDIHTPDEKMNLPSFNRVSEYLVKVLERL